MGERYRRSQTGINTQTNRQEGSYALRAGAPQVAWASGCVRRETREGEKRERGRRRATLSETEEFTHKAASRFDPRCVCAHRESNGRVKEFMQREGARDAEHHTQYDVKERET